MAELHLNRSWSDSALLDTVLKAGAVISGGDPSESKASNPSGLPDVLHSRLEQFDASLDGITRTRSLELQSLQLNTAFASLYVLERIHGLLVEHEAQYDKGPAPPLIGTRDMAQIRTHLSILLNWGIELLFTRILPTLPDRPMRSSRVPPGAHIIDLTAAHEDYMLLFDISSRLLKIILPEGPEGSSSTTIVAMTIMSRGLTDILRSCIFLAWLPNDLRGDIPSTLDLRFYVVRLLNGSQPAQSITALGTIMRKMQKPAYVRKVCRILSTEQLLRPSGIAGLFSSVFGEDVSSTDAPLEKLQSTANVLTTLPPNIPAEEYYSMTIPRLLHLLSPAMDNLTPPAHRRATAFSLSRMLGTSREDGGIPPSDAPQNVIEWCLLDPFKPVRRPKLPFSGMSEVTPLEPLEPVSSNPSSKARSIAQDILILSPSQAAPTLSTILMNTDPSPELIDILLRPIAPQLYTLLEYLRTSKTADPMLRETVEGLLGTWARAAGKDEIVDALWKVVEGKAGEWDIDEDGELRVFERSASLPLLTLAQLADLQEGKLDSEEDEEANPLDLHPYPLYFAQFLKSIKRDDVASALYLRILDAHVKLGNEGDPLRKLLLFKLSMQISTQLGADAGTDSPLRRPDVTRMLMFIKMSLEQDDTLKGLRAGEGGRVSRERLRFVSNGEGDDDDGDSDDEDLAPGLEGVSKHEHLSVTAVNLLLALLEEHPDLSPKTVPLLNEIYSQLEPLADADSDALRSRAREARITLTARLASSSAFPTKQAEQVDTGEESPQEKYQRALKLLQDPLLPVRAHGLLLLRELVAPVKAARARRKENDRGGWGTGATSSAVQGTPVGQPSVDAALIPAILSIFMQSIQDEDSYIFLNAVQGLAAMVDGFGREVLKGLVDEYSKGMEGVGGSAGTMTVREVDLRVRVGEALGQVIRRCSGALGKYVDIIVPRLFAVVRASHLPTTLRTSAVSLLATAAGTNAVALSAYTLDLISAMVDLVQVESVRATPAPTKTKSHHRAHSPEIAEAASDLPKEPDGKGEMYLGDVEITTRSQSRTKVSPGAGTEKIAPCAKDDKAEGAAADAVTVEDTMDARPTAANAKFPPLRRAALHFLSLLLRSLIQRVYDQQRNQIPGSGGAVGIPPQPEMKRADSVLGYVSITDEDGVVRVMAREAAELLQQLRNAMLGL